ncbi:MAG TPA: sensor histidine kinase [Trebonia sp.]
MDAYGAAPHAPPNPRPSAAPTAAPRTRSRRPGWAPDAAAAVVSVAVLVVVSAHLRPGPDALGYALLTVAGVTMGLCRRWPRLAVGIVTAILGAFIVRHYPNGPVWATGWGALGALTWQTSRRTAIAGAVVMLAVLSALALLAGQHGALLPVIFAGWAAAAVFGGDALRARNGRLAALRERARFLELTREEEARRRVAEERLRIARDLHDSVAHAMTAINVQAGAAVHVLSRRPQEAGEAAGTALAAIQRASGEVLEELSAMLAVLRDDDGQGADRAPLPGAGQVARLTETAKASGLDVTLREDGPVADIPPLVGTAAYRVVQESLTNVLRHSRARTARVQLAIRPDGSVLTEVADDGPAAPPPGHETAGEGSVAPGTGVGIRGMRERVISTGGRFHASPVPGGGFLVRAVWDARP